MLTIEDGGGGTVRMSGRLDAAEAAAAQAAVAAPAPPPRRLKPIAVSTPQPNYPPDALRAGVTGEVEVSIVIGRDGSVRDARVVRSRPRGTFDRSVLATVRTWRFEPLDEEATLTRTIQFR